MNTICNLKVERDNLLSGVSQWDKLPVLPLYNTIKDSETKKIKCHVSCCLPKLSPYVLPDRYNTNIFDIDDIKTVEGIHLRHLIHVIKNLDDISVNYVIVPFLVFAPGSHKHGQQWIDTRDQLSKSAAASLCRITLSNLTVKQENYVMITLHGVGRVMVDSFSMDQNDIITAENVSIWTHSEHSMSQNALKTCNKSMLDFYKDTKVLSAIPDLVAENGGIDYAVLKTLEGADMSRELIDNILPVTDFLCGHVPLEDYRALMLRIQSTQNLSLLINDVYQVIAQCKTYINLNVSIIKKFNEALERNNREYYIHEKLKILQQEASGGESVVMRLKRQIRSIQSLSKEALQKLETELEKFAHMHSNSPEFFVSLHYMEKIMSLPWDEAPDADMMPLEQAKEILDKSCYGLDKVKQRVLEHIFIEDISGKKQKGAILCLAGDPGVGKTSIARTIGSITGRQVFTVSLGGMHDTHEIRGHRRTYIGSNVGCIIDKVITAKSTRILIILDEIDKISNTGYGMLGALLEILDPEMNHSFRDLFLDISFDISNVVFICTANNVYDMHPALHDRLEIVKVSGYTVEDKRKIVQEWSVPICKQQYNCNAVLLSNSTIDYIISFYTFESGVRNLVRIIRALIRRAAFYMYYDSSIKKVRVDKKMLIEVLGRPQMITSLPDKAQIGYVTGMGYIASSLGCTTSVEALMLSGSGKLHVTGNLGNLMEESVQVAYTVSKSTIMNHMNIFTDMHNLDAYVHFAGAANKDGPSAGSAITIALVSALTKRATYGRSAVTGEVNLRGEVLAVGGIMEKVQSAILAGANTLYIPKQNQHDFELIPNTLTKNVTTHFCSHISEVVNKILMPAS